MYFLSLEVKGLTYGQQHCYHRLQVGTEEKLIAELLTWFQAVIVPPFGTRRQTVTPYSLVPLQAELRNVPQGFSTGFLFHRPAVFSADPLRSARREKIQAQEWQKLLVAATFALLPIMIDRQRLDIFLNGVLVARYRDIGRHVRPAN